MTNDEKAKAYEMALEAARKELGVDRKEWEVVQRVLHNIFPELRESEDERMAEMAIKAVLSPEAQSCIRSWGVNPDDVIAWLEKQKENPKSADSIPADCVSSAKCEDRWHKTVNSLPDTGRDVLAKDALGNFLLASFDGAQWFVSVYDGQDHPVLHTPPILEWCDIPSETYKESLHISESCKENADSLTSDEPTPSVILDEQGRVFATQQKEQKPTWSEFDKGVLKDAICAADILGNDESFNKGNPNLGKAFRVAKDWFKSLPERFNLQPKQEWNKEDDGRIRAFLIKKFSELGEIWPEYSSKTIISWLEKS